jgi:hypothetical protein
MAAVCQIDDIRVGQEPSDLAVHGESSDSGVENPDHGLKGPGMAGSIVAPTLTTVTT